MHMDPEGMNNCTDYPFLTFSTAELQAPLYVAGSPVAELYLSATSVDADLSVWIWEYNPSRSPPSQLVKYGALQARYRDGYENASFMTPGEVVKMEVAALSFAHEFSAGSHLVLNIGGSPCMSIENTHTGSALDDRQRWQAADYSLHYGRDYPARLILPVMASE